MFSAIDPAGERPARFEQKDRIARRCAMSFGISFIPMCSHCRMGRNWIMVLFMQGNSMRSVRMAEECAFMER